MKRMVDVLHACAAHISLITFILVWHVKISAKRDNRLRFLSCTYRDVLYLNNNNNNNKFYFPSSTPIVL